VTIRDVFIVMPFTEQQVILRGAQRTYSSAHLDDVYAIICDSVREYDESITVSRMDQPYGNLVSAIIQRLSTADVVIAVLAGRNPNVFYELGIRHSLRRNTIMLVEDRDEYPFDLSAYFSHEYSIAHESDRRALKAFIGSRLAEITSKSLPDSPVLDVLQQAEHEHLRVLNAWETRRALMVLAGIVHEIAAVRSRVADIIKSLIERDTEVTPHRLVWDVLDGFTKTRPVPGLQAAAYDDAESLYFRFRHLDFEWDSIAADTEDPVEIRNQRVLLMAETYGVTLGFLYDAVTALDFVMREQRAYGLPWSGAYHAVRDVNVMTSITAVEISLNDYADEIWRRFAKFEHEYLGVPRDVMPASSSPFEPKLTFATILQRAQESAEDEVNDEAE